MEAGKIKFILLKKIGKAVIDRTVTDDEILAAIEEINFSERMPMNKEKKSRIIMLLIDVLSRRYFWYSINLRNIWLSYI